MTTRLDHIVVAAKTLEAGVQYIYEKLGVDIPPGGRHEMMGTHNHVMSLGNGVYLEVIAVNFDMIAPCYPRWFGLDDPFVRNRLEQGPMLLTWAVNSDGLESLVSKSMVALGQIKNAQRDDLRWRVALTEDGRLPAAGFLPLCIEWQMDFHPSERMIQAGCALISLDIYHQRSDWLLEALNSIGMEESAGSLVHIHPLDDAETPYIICTLKSPKGNVTLSSLD